MCFLDLVWCSVRVFSLNQSKECLFNVRSVTLSLTEELPFLSVSQRLRESTLQRGLKKERQLRRRLHRRDDRAQQFQSEDSVFLCGLSLSHSCQTHVMFHTGLADSI